MEINSRSYLRGNHFKKNEYLKLKAEGNGDIKGINVDNERLNTTITKKDNVENEKNYKSNESISAEDFIKSDNKEEKIEEAIEILNKLLHKRKSKIEVENHDFFKNDLMMKIIDEETGEVLVEVPPKKILDMIATMVEMAEGIVIDKKA
ncbi:flagellar protein FlaG [Oceanirhabdus seepicola]|uniref:Flagellar protein FlaG n=1 Tax=Oceanirhabdus seepicola TaxID=2828781 RepID=A0A9J6NVT7_9CLOT|nr:flagellar protein FlaG [Oceanirhabdus seepicola]MCM1988110.1 flagellar protein FlaG [Oceanirhabdus seepicola]